MSLDRAWPRRPMFAPARWAESIPDLWAESEVILGRAANVEDDYGGFKPGGANAAYLTVMMHVEMSRREPVGPLNAPGATFHRVLRAAGKLTPAQLADPNLLPIRGDTMTWVHPVTGEHQTLPIRHVFIAYAGDHVELISEVFE